MDKKDFMKLEGHVFDEGNPWDIWEDGSRKPNKLPYFASWALYDDSIESPDRPIKNEKAEQIVMKNIDILKGNIVFVALNFSNLLAPDWRHWCNIRGNYNVRWLLDGNNFNVEKYRGAYITDIIKNHIGSVANDVMNEIERKKINKNIDLFIEEIEMLPSENIEMYLFGTDVENIFKNYIMNDQIKIDRLKLKVKKCQRIEHYSGSNNGRFRKFAPSQLGLIDPPEPDTPMIFLWNDIES